MQLEKGNENSYLLALALRHRGGPGDVAEAIQIFRRIATEAQPQAAGFRENVAQHVIELLSKENLLAEIAQFLQEVPGGSISDVTMATLRGIAAWLAKNQEEAIEWANVALHKLSEPSSPNDRRRLAGLLSSCGHHEEALPLWQSLADTTKLNDDCRHLIECALKLGKEGIVLSTCKALREAGVNDMRLFEVEVALLEKYDVNTAAKLIQDHLADHPDDRPMRLSLSVLGLRLNRRDLVPIDLNLLPKPEEILPEKLASPHRDHARGGAPQRSIAVRL